MKSTTVIELTPQDLKNLMKEAIGEFENEKSENESLSTIYTFNKVRLILGCSHSTVKKLVNEGIIKTTSDQRRIPAKALEEYLQSKINKS